MPPGRHHAPGQVQPRPRPGPHHDRRLRPGDRVPQADAQDRAVLQPGSAARMTRVIAWLSLAAVALVAAIAGYLHALVVVQAADGRTAGAWFIPLLADLVMAAGAAKVLDASRTGHARRGWSMVAIGVGLAATLYPNLPAGVPHLVPAWLVNVRPPVAF